MENRTTFANTRGTQIKVEECSLITVGTMHASSTKKSFLKRKRLWWSPFSRPRFLPLARGGMATWSLSCITLISFIRETKAQEPLASGTKKTQEAVDTSTWQKKKGRLRYSMLWKTQHSSTGAGQSSSFQPLKGGTEIPEKRHISPLKPQALWTHNLHTHLL